MAQKPGLLRRLFTIHTPKEARQWGGNSLAEAIAWGGGRSRYSTTPQVNDTTALQLGAVWACVDLISELVSTLPIDEYRLQGDVRVKLPSSSFLLDPAGDGSGVEVWLRQLLTSLLLRGNGYGLILAVGQDGWPTQIESLHPDRVRWYRKSNTGPAETQLDYKDIDRWPAGPLWHVPAYPTPGSPVGMSPLAYAAETIGLGLATQQFGLQWFSDGAHPSSKITSEHEINQEQALIIKQRVREATFNNREPIVLGAGIDINSIQVTPNESQFLETIGANVADVARFFRVPPEMIGGDSGSSMTYANVESRSLALLTYTMNPWLVRLERALSRLRPRPRFVKFNADALVRVDLATRYGAHDMAIRGGWRSVNEARRIEDEPPIGSAGDEFLWPPYSTTEPAAAPVGGPPQ